VNAKLHNLGAPPGTLFYTGEKREGLAPGLLSAPEVKNAVAAKKLRAKLVDAPAAPAPMVPAPGPVPQAAAPDAPAPEAAEPPPADPVAAPEQPKSKKRA